MPSSVHMSKEVYAIYMSEERMLSFVHMFRISYVDMLRGVDNTKLCGN